VYVILAGGAAGDSSRVTSYDVHRGSSVQAEKKKREQREEKEKEKSTP